MSDSTRRALRTLYHGLVGLLTVVPIVLTALPDGSPLAVKLSSVVVASAVVSRVLNGLEDAGLIPAWLRGNAPEE